ncbi:hypothetical protein QAD02_012647 [Eretmocerus hayati]|uniref:Uncharacterized protein n=1 Tax=Eretmocerus hayati TaxID=131215 RepID=A0ACC2P511_9HYME|nr:hypothetical protein QAD02_012647 [Eretmocerus hayati]
MMGVGWVVEGAAQGAAQRQHRLGKGLKGMPFQGPAALNSTNAAALQASLATGLGASLATSSLLNSSLTNDLASNLGSFQGVANLANLQASLSQPHPTFNSRSFTKLDDEVAFANSSTFVNPSLSNSRDLNNVLIKNHVDRLPINVVAFSSNVEQIRTRQTSNGSRVSDTILIGNVSICLHGTVHEDVVSE